MSASSLVDFEVSFAGAKLTSVTQYANGGFGRYPDGRNAHTDHLNLAEPGKPQGVFNRTNSANNSPAQFKSPRSYSDARTTPSDREIAAIAQIVTIDAAQRAEALHDFVDAVQSQRLPVGTLVIHQV